MGLTSVYVVTAWIQVLVTLALLIATVRSFRKSPFPLTRRNRVILALVWAGFLVSRLPFAYLVLPLGAYVLSIGALMALVSTVHGHRPDAVGADVRRLEGLPPLGSFRFCTTTPRHRPGRFS